MTDETEAEEQAPAPLPAKLLGRAVALVPLTSYAERWDLAAAAGTSVQRASAAALALSWPRLRKELPAYRGDALEYGGQAIDYLCSRGVQYQHVVGHGVAALRAATTGLIGDQEVKADEDFSGASGAAST